jgi:hypothetical protein
MIAESTPFGGIVSWSEWFQPTLDLIHEYDISMFSYINCNWEAQPMWHNVGFGETRLSTNEHVMHHWYNRIIRGERFLGAGSLANCGMSREQISIDSITATFLHPIPPHQYNTFHLIVVTLLLLFSVSMVYGAWRWRRAQNLPLSGWGCVHDVAAISRSSQHYSYSAVEDNQCQNLQQSNE